jgi:hypothetical protein
MGDEPRNKAFLRGYEEGLKAAWREIGALTTRGYSSTEISVMAKSKMAVLYRDVEAMALRLDMDAGSSLEDPSPKGDIVGRGAYLVREPRAERIFELYEELVRGGGRGLCITRMHPGDYRARYGLPNSGYVWLSKSVGRRESGMAVVEPTALVDLASAIADFASEGGHAAILLEGLEYLIAQNGFPSVERFLQKVNERVVLNDSVLLISANPAALREQEYKLIVREMVREI